MKSSSTVTLNITKVSKHISHFDFEDEFGDMRDFTPEESEAYEESLHKIYKPTGINIFDLANKEGQ